jgi:chemotaxis protein histidine kinase CheA
VKLLVNALEGEIKLESEEGEGCIFTVLLPVANKSITLNEVVTCSIGYNQFYSGDSRIVQTASIEFSDIYLDRR